MKNLYDNINKVLSEWNPIGVDENIATDEYKGYVQTILKSIDNEDKLLKCLETILIEHLGMPYDNENENHINDLHIICHKLIEVYNEYQKIV